MNSLERAEVSELIDTPRNLQRGTTVVKSMNDYLINHVETPEVNWIVAGMIKGGVFGEYIKMRNQGDILVANYILREAELSQSLSAKQRARLTYYDSLI